MSKIKAQKTVKATKGTKTGEVKGLNQTRPRPGKHTDKLIPPKNITPEPEVIIKKIKRSAAELKQFRERLQKLHDLTIDSIGFLAGGRSGKYGDSRVSRVNGDGQNSGEDGTASFSQDLSLMQMSNKKDMLIKIVEAFRRLDLQTYGVCETCGELITKARLEVQPFAPLCIKCQSASEANRPRSQGFGKSMMLMAQTADSSEPTRE